MSKEKKQNKQQRSSRNIDMTTDESGLHVQHPPKGSEKMDASFSGGTPREEGNSSQYANTSDNEKNERLNKRNRK